MNKNFSKMFIFSFVSLLMATTDVKSDILTDPIPISNLLVSAFDIRFFTTVFCFLCVLYVLARPYSFFKRVNECSIVNTGTLNGRLHGPIVLIILKYFLIGFTFYKPELYSYFSSELNFTKQWYIIFGIIDLILMGCLLRIDCIGSVAKPIITTLSFLYLFYIRLLIHTGRVHYFFSGVVLDIFCCSFLFAVIIAEKDKIFNFIINFWTKLTLFFTASELQDPKNDSIIESIV